MRCDRRPPRTVSTREEIGRADPDWPDWYAHYVVDERTGQTGGA